MVVVVPSPVVRVLAPKVTDVPATPASDPMVSAPVKVRLPVPDNTTAAVSSNDVPSTLSVDVLFTFTTVDNNDPLTTKVPPVTVVAPV